MNRLSAGALSVGGLRRRASEMMSSVGVGSSPVYSGGGDTSLARIKSVEQVYQLVNISFAFTFFEWNFF